MFTKFFTILRTKSIKPQCIEKLLSKQAEKNNFAHKLYHSKQPSIIHGIEHLRDPRYNKGLAFTLEERQLLSIHGLLPPCFKTQDQQLEHCIISLDRYQEDLNKYLYLTTLHDRSEQLFFRLLTENVETVMPIIYTPTVGLACQKFGLMYRRPRGLFITINDRGHIANVLQNWPEKNIRAICVTDGGRTLGLGDLGASSMGIPVGKLALYTALAGIKPHECLPITLDVGTNNEELLCDPMYIGLRQRRLTGPKYDEFIDEFMTAVINQYGHNTLIQFEDFANHNAFKFLDKYRNSHCTFNDDIQGTAAVVLAGLYASTKLSGKQFVDYKILFVGAGEAAIGIADLCCKAMELNGMKLEDTRHNIWMTDVDGLLTKCRNEANLDESQRTYAKDHKPVKNLRELVQIVKPSVIIGASAMAALFTQEILQDMALFNERPIVFALSNPTSKSECTPQEAFNNTEGRVIFCSGSPFPPVNFNGKSIKTGQANNAYIFPGVSLGIIATGMRHIPDDIFLIAACELAATVSDEDVKSGILYPSLVNIREVSLRIATGIAKYAYCNGLASTYPEPIDKRKWLQNQLYDYRYTKSTPPTWSWNKSEILCKKS